MADILVIHDQLYVRESLLDRVRASDHRASGAIDLNQAVVSLAGVEYAAVLIGIPHRERIGPVVQQVKHEWPTADVIVIGHSSDLSDATEAIRQGAYEYIAWPVTPSRLAAVLLGASERHRASGGRIDHLDDQPEDLPFVEPATLSLLASADRAAAVGSTVLITGETGTGKEVLARRIHRHSARRRNKFVPVNCGSLPETLVETELFGYRRGAFTGAVSNTKGLIEEADGGVLFLDEIGDMPLPMQVRLLRFLDSGEIRAVGDTAIKHVDVRVIAATNMMLWSAIREHRFRQDLFFRLSVISLQLPPLRDRRGDIPALVHYHLRRAARRLCLPVPAITDEAVSVLVRYDWPGNIRELQNALEQALVQDTDRVITPHELPLAIQRASPHQIVATHPINGNDHEMLTTILRRHRGNHAEAAAALGISRTKLWRRLRQVNVNRPTKGAGEPDSPGGA